MGAPHKAVILARGLGSRMRKEAEAELDEAQAAVAATGVKAMISVGRPFLDFVISAIADAGFDEVCLVIGPEHDTIREHYSAEPLSRVRISYAIQPEPLGTANALLAAESFAAGDRVLVLNSDNYYPAEALAELGKISGSGLAGFDRAALTANSNIPPERLAAFALVTSDGAGKLAALIEKPSAEQVNDLGEAALVSMNCWLCGPAIFAAAASIAPSARGEYELPDAVRAAHQAGDPYQVVPVAVGVLDMSSRTDIAAVAHALNGVEVRL